MFQGAAATNLVENQDSGRAMSGIIAQLDRSDQFRDTIDLGAALSTRVRLKQLLLPQLSTLRERAGLPAAPPHFAVHRSRKASISRYQHLPIPTDRIFTYWNAPIETAPPLVQACIGQLRRIYPQIQVLDGAGVRRLITIPPRISSLLEDDRPAHFSDYIRTRILEEHGGVWFDATVFVASRFDDELRGYLRAGTIFPRWTRSSIANWFIASHAQSPMISLQRQALELWWDTYDDLPDYFLYHRIFEVITDLVPEVRGQWLETPTLSATSTHLLQLSMMQQWNPIPIGAMLLAMPIQKLSYKYGDVPPGSVLERLLERGLVS